MQGDNFHFINPKKLILLKLINDMRIKRDQNEAGFIRFYFITQFH